MRIFFLIFMMLGAFYSCTPTNSPEGYIDDFFSTYQTERIEKAIENIFQTNPSLIGKEEMTNLSDKIISDISLLGKFGGYEFIVKRKLGESLIHFSYLVKYDVTPLRFTFVFYKVGSEWKLQSFSYDADVISELKESANFIYLE